MSANFWLCLLLFAVLGCEKAKPDPEEHPVGTVSIAPKIPPSDHWEPDIAAWERRDSIEMPEPGGVVFLGSSSIRLWETLEKDMAPLPVVQRGFGGSRIFDAVRFADRIVLKYDPRIVVVFSGTNDIRGDDTDLPPEMVLEGYRQLTEQILAHSDSTDVYYISITPSRARYAQLERVKQANRLIETYSESRPQLHFFDLQDIFLLENGKIREELFVTDGLHLNERGYALWTERIKPELLRRYYEN